MATKKSKSEASVPEPAKAELLEKLTLSSAQMRRYADMQDKLTEIIMALPLDDDTLAQLTTAADVPFTKPRKRRGVMISEGGDGRKRKREVKEKDPNAPKRPASAYLLFQNQVRSKYKTANPNLPQSDLLQLISQQWSNMPQEEKQVYQRQAETAKEKWKTDKIAYEGQDHTVEAEAAPDVNTSLKPVKAKPISKATVKKPVLKGVPKSAPVAPTSESDSEAESDSSEDVKQAAKATEEDDEEEEDEEEDEEEEEEVPPPPAKKPKSHKK